MLERFITWSNRLSYRLNLSMILNRQEAEGEES